VTLTANQILKNKTIPEMTNQEIDIVMNRAKRAAFDRDVATFKYRIDLKKRAMGKWALDIFKTEKNTFIKFKIKGKYLEEINYYLKNKEVRQPTEAESKVDNLIKDLEYELVCRSIDN